MIAAALALAIGCARESSRGAAPSAAATPSPATSAPAPIASAPRAAAPADAVSLEGGAWTAGIVERKARGAPIALLRAVRAARHAELDRVVFEFDGTALPAYHVEYVDRPVRRCGSGDVAELAGDGWLEVRLEPAAAHGEVGEPLLAAREQHPGLPIVREIELTCDFEAHVNVVLGVASPNRFRVLELSSPTRLVVDVRHR